MYKYETIIYWNEEDQSFIADVPELPGCMAHGASPDEALANAQEAMCSIPDHRIVPSRSPLLLAREVFQALAGAENLTDREVFAC